MKKPNNFDNTQVSGDFTPVNLGGHYAVIKQVNETTSKTGKDMIVVLFDFVAPDQQADYFMNSFKADIRPDKKWPGNGATWIGVIDQNGNCSRGFKGFTTAVEHSNPGFITVWGDGFAASYKNKLVGGVFREEIGVYNGKETHQRKLAWFCSNEKADGANIPAPIETKEYKAWKESGGLTSNPADDNGWMNIPDSVSDEELPFN